MNKIILSGRLADDPKMNKTVGGLDVCNFTLAVDRPGTKKENRVTDFFNITVWGNKEGPGAAGVIEKYFHKGDGINLSGVMTTRKYEEKDTGKNRTAYSVQMQDFEFPLYRKTDQSGNTAPAPQSAQATAPSGYTEVNQEELPF